MQRIQILERDYTTPILDTYDNEVAFVPGFGTAGPVDKPTLCTTLSELLETFCTKENNTYILPSYSSDQRFPQVGESVPSATCETTIAGGSATVDADAFYERITQAGEYTFTASVAGSDISWSLSGEAVELANYGITYTGSPANNDTIEVTLTVAVSQDGFPAVAVPASGIWASGETEGALIDPSFLYAAGLLSSGIQVIYERMNSSSNDITVETAYSKLAQYYSLDGELADKNTYNIKYLTSGGYPTFEYSTDISGMMLALAAGRGDCIAFIDHTNNPERPLTGTNSVLAAVRSNSFGNEFSAMFTPWGSYTTYSGNHNMPGSYAYLTALGRSNQTNDSWLAIAGIARGGVSNLTASGILTTATLTNTIAEDMGYTNEDICINPITRINGVQTIWGNRTLAKNSGGATAISFLNIRNLMCDVKKQAYTAAKAAIFEPNDDILWLNFKSAITPLLDRMVAGRGLTNYKVIKNANVDPTKLDVTIRLYPIYAVESVDISIELYNDETVVTTEE